MECVSRLCVLAAVCTVFIQHSSQAPMPQPADEMYEAVVEYLQKHPGERARKALEILRQRVEVIQGGKAGLKDLSEEQRKELVEHYVEEVVSPNVLVPYGSQSIPESMKDMMQEYLENHRRQVEAAKAGPRAGLMSIAKQFLGGADTDLLKDLLRIHTHDTTRAQGPLSPQRTMLYALVKQVSMYPEVEHLHAMLATSLGKKAEGMDKAFLAVVFTNMLNRPGASDQQRDLAKSCLQLLLEDEDFVSQNPDKVMEMWLQQFVSHLNKKMKTRDMIAFGVANALQDMHDEESSKMAAAVVFHVMTHTMVEDIPEEDRWKWLPPTICSVEKSNGEVMGSHPCPKDMQCSVGPTDVRVNDTDYTIRLCSMPTTCLLFHACQVMYTNGTMVHEDYHCPQEECTVGPVRVQWNSYIHGVNVDLDVKYCTSLPNNYGKEQTIVDRSCAVTNQKSKALMQRECKAGYMCSLGPFPIDGQDENKAWLCTEMPDDDDDFMTEIIDIVLGNDLMEEEDHLPRNASEADREFMEFVIQHITENAGKQMEDDTSDPDTIGLMILHHFVEEMEENTGSAGLIGEVYDTLQNIKVQHGMEFGDMDRKPLHFLIMYLVNEHKAEEQRQQKAPLHDLLQGHLDMHQGGADSSSSEEKSESEEQDAADKLVKLLMMLSGQGGQDGKTQSGSDSRSKSDSGSQEHSRSKSDSRSESDSGSQGKGLGHNALLETMVRMYLEGGDNLDQEMLSNLITAYLGSTQGGQATDSKQEQGGEQDELLRGVADLLLHHGAAHGNLRERQDHHANQIQDLMQRLKSGSSEGTSEEEEEEESHSEEGSDEGSDEEMKEMLRRMLGGGSK